MPGAAPHLIPIGRSGEWFLWRDCALRSAGIAVRRVDTLADPVVAALGDAANGPASDVAGAVAEYQRRWPAAVASAHRAIDGFATDPLFREAVAWQNPPAVRHTLDGPRRKPSQRLAVVRYAQRYTVKNDTIGFFGPVAWARFGPAATAVTARPGPALIAEAEVRFEAWAIDALAARLSADPAVRPHLCPRIAGNCRYAAGVIARPYGAPVWVDGQGRAVLDLCDGRRTVTQLAELTGRSVPLVLDLLDEFIDAQLVRLDLIGPVETHPEATLRRRLVGIPDATVRGGALARLDRLVAARDDLAGALGDPARVLAGMVELGRTFFDVTGHEPMRRAGQAYAGRTPVYLEATRSVSVELGQPLLAALAPPLCLILKSARWFAGTVAERYRQLLGDLFVRCGGSAARPVPLARLLGAAMSAFVTTDEFPEPVAAARGELQARWSRVLRIPPGTARHTVRCAEIAAAVDAEFASGPAPWSQARYHAPDVLISAVDQDALAGGDVQLVLGELHLANNTLEARPFAASHPDPGRLLAAVEADHGDHRIYAVPSRRWPQVNSRTYPAALLSSRYTYWSLYGDDTGAPGVMRPAADLWVHARDGGLVVHAGDGAEFSLIEMLGEQLSAVVVNAMSVQHEAPHRPRIGLDRLVVQRESWRFRCDELDWWREPDDARRFRAARRWRAGFALPRRAFYRTTARAKPVYVDFASIPLVDLLGRNLRRAADRGEYLDLSEMLPDPANAWLPDAGGERYTAELRLAAVDGVRLYSDGTLRQSR